jgi:anaphase-promoting complex subunit 8
MPNYALHYYRKAAAIRPYDARMWCAVAGCFEAMSRLEEAIKCYQRAESNNDREGELEAIDFLLLLLTRCAGIALSKLASLYHEIGNIDMAAQYCKKNLARYDCCVHVPNAALTLCRQA